MEPDFSGYATKAGLKCSDGRTIMPDAFKDMNGKTVPLVWQHGHKDPSNVLGHAVLESRKDGVYAYGYFNGTPKGKDAKQLVQHKDITSLSIFANQLVEKAKQVFHGKICEVSLVLSGANPGAFIENVRIAHSDGDIETLDEEAVIYTGLELQHEDQPENLGVDDNQQTQPTENNQQTQPTENNQQTQPTENNQQTQPTENNQQTQPTENNQQTQPTENNQQTQPTGTTDENVAHTTVQEIYDGFTDEQKNVVNYMISAAIDLKKEGATHSSDDNTEGNSDMTRNVFENGGGGQGGTSTDTTHTLTHDDMKGIVADAVDCGSLKKAVQNYAIAHGIDNIDVLFPDAKNIENTPEFQQRRTEWVAGVLNGTRHTPFSRIRTRSADITHEEARAKGYIKGTLKKEEFFGVSKRVTTPTTVYKKQKLDRDDVLDITDFDVVAWMKAEMRLMIEEELAAAILVGDGRDVTHEDKIKDPAGAAEGAGIRSILHDHELYVTHVNVGLPTTDPDYNDVVEAVMRARRFYKGSGTPTFYTTVQTSTEMLLSKDAFGRRRWNNKEELANALGVSSVVDVEVMDREPDLLGILVNLNDYTVGTDQGGELSLFDFFDIDYNQYKYLIESRVSGALTKIKSAMVVHRQAVGDVLITPVAPAFDGVDTITIPTDANVDYFADGVAATDGDDVVIPAGETVEITAVPTTGHYFRTNEEDQWTFRNDS